LDVRDHPSADKLYVLDIEVGLEKRKIVAGIKKYYEKEELIDKNIVVVANLKPATIRSVESQGMLLAAEDDKGISILIADGKSSDPVFVEGIKGEPAEVLELDEFEKIEMFVGKKGEILYKRKALKTEKGNARVDRKVREGSRIS
jgi:methionyl-tRNA synthetase